MVELSGESLQPLLTWRPGDPGPRPGFGGRGEDLRYMQGTVVRWDPETAENIVRIRGADHTNVPLIDLGIGQRSIQAGDQVAIMAWSPNGGTAAYFIMGRLVVPGTAAAQRSEQTLESLIAQLTLPIFGQAIRFGSGFGTTNISNDDSNPTPIVDVVSSTQVSATATVGDTGRALTIMSADRIGARPDTGHTGFINMYYHISGAHSSTSNAPAMSIGRGAAHSSETVGENPAAAMSRVFVEQNLSPGESTFSLFGDWTNPGNGHGFVSNPEIIVIPF